MFVEKFPFWKRTLSSLSRVAFSTLARDGRELDHIRRRVTNRRNDQSCFREIHEKYDESRTVITVPFRSFRAISPRMERVFDFVFSKTRLSLVVKGGVGETRARVPLEPVTADRRAPSSRETRSTGERRPPLFYPEKDGSSQAV